MNFIEVFIITYNRLSYFNHTLKSITDQSIINLKITVIENGSNEANKINIALLDKSIKIIRYDQNVPVFEIFEKIKTLITKDYLIVFHDDDLMHPLYLTLCNKILTKYLNQIDLIGTKFQPFFDNDSINFTDIINVNNVFCNSNSDLAALLYSGEYLHYGSVVYKAEIFKNTSLNFNKYGKICDRPFILECSSHGKSIYIDAPLVKYRLHESQDSTNAVNGPFLDQLINLEKLYFTILTESFFTNYNMIYLKHCFKYLNRNFTFLKNNKLYNGTIFDYIKYSLRLNATNYISILIGGTIYFYLYLFRKVRT